VRWSVVPVILLGAIAWASATSGFLATFVLPLTAGLAGVIAGWRGRLTASAAAGLGVYLVKWALLLGPLLLLVALFPSPDWADTIAALPGLARIAVVELAAAAVVGLLGGLVARHLQREGAGVQQPPG
jgi:hypothetical protein